MDKDIKPSFYPQPPPPHYNHELYMRMVNKEVIVTINDGFPGMQVLVFEERKQ